MSLVGWSKSGGDLTTVADQVHVHVHAQVNVNVNGRCSEARVIGGDRFAKREHINAR